MPHKISASEALNEVTKLKNLYRAAEKIEEILQAVADADGELARIKQETKEHETARADALQKSKQASFVLDEKQKQVERFIVDTHNAAEREQQKYSQMVEKYQNDERRLSQEIKQLEEKRNQLMEETGKMQASLDAMYAELQGQQIVPRSYQVRIE